MKRKVLAGMLSVALAGTMLAGCGETAEKEPVSEAVQGGNTEADEAEGNEEAGSGEAVTVTYLRPGTAPEQNEELLKAINDKLEADGTGLQLDIMYVPSDVFSDKVNMMMSAGEEFDLLAVMEDQKSFTTYIGSEGIMPITEYVKESEVLQKVIPDWMWESATVKGEIYTIPAN